jgi:hypothetical protein
MIIPAMMNMITAVKRRAVERMENKMSSVIFCCCVRLVCVYCCRVLDWLGGGEETGLGFMKKKKRWKWCVFRAMLLRF